MTADIDQSVPQYIADKLSGVLSRSALSGALKDLKRLTAGAGSETWMFHLDETPYIMQRTAGDNIFPLNINRSDQATVMKAAFNNGLSVADVKLVFRPEDGLGDGFISGFLEGETVAKIIQRDDDYAPLRQNFAAEAAKALSCIHNAPTGDLQHLPELGTQSQLTAYEDLYKNSEMTLPVFDFAFAWLHANQPTEGTHQLVHGDFRIGNFMVSTDKIVALLDWEMSHLGDPYEDLTWLAVKPWRFMRRDLPIAGICARGEFYEAYERETGVKVDKSRIKYWEVFGLLKWGVMCIFMTQQYMNGEVPTLERAAIGRRISENELDIMNMIGEA